MRPLAGWFGLAALAIGTFALAAHPEGKVPHFSQCSRCTKCIASGQNTRHVFSAAGNESRLPEQLQPRQFAPSRSFYTSEHRPKCEVCSGCSMQLIDISEAPPVDLAEYKLQFHSDPVTSSRTTWVMKAVPLPSDTPGKARKISSKPPDDERDQSALVKVFCVPRELGKTDLHKGHWASENACSQDAYARTMLNIGLKRLSEDCGMGEMLPDVWADYVQGTLPVTNASKAGYTVDWMGCWNSFVPGVSVKHVLKTPPGATGLRKDLHKRLNKTQVILGALFDVLTSQSDRHSKNVLILEDGQLRLIDNEECMGHHPLSRFLKRGVNSMFIPGTENYNRLHAKHTFEGEKSAVVPFSLDYRCAVDDGAADKTIGFKYPTGFSHCLQRISSMSTKEIKDRYHLPHVNQPENLKQCATELLERGFEWTYTRGTAQSTPWFLRPFMPAAPSEPHCD
uniref:PI3K/PI4K catalytic domain-containing protein n=4 Tax=Dunaliella tertiolecta TaxID=3047 RepID=A0A6S8IGF5_DUNTE|mmetsp:Transcript_24134/g.66073  ORF Transcript_24134/g.66073 Transcript_24134/m.66073 type:complete len:452 (-) Transcript_24134:1122-2477(-)